MSNPYAFAARRPLPIMVLVAAIAGGLLVFWWLFPLGLFAYGLIVFLGGHDPQLAAASQRTPRPRLSSPTFRAQLGAIERTQEQIGRSVAEAEGPLAALLARIDAQTADLVEQAYELCERGQVIEGYLARVNQSELQQRIAATDQQLAATADPYTRQQLEETRAALAEKQRNAGELTTYVGRIQAQLQNIHANLENVLAETVRLRTADALAADSATTQVAQRLADLKSDMDTFQRVLDTALAGAAP